MCCGMPHSRTKMGRVSFVDERSGRRTLHCHSLCWGARKCVAEFNHAPRVFSASEGMRLRGEGRKEVSE